MVVYSGLTDLQLRFWRDRGYLIVKEVFSPDDLDQLRMLMESGTLTCESRSRYMKLLDENLHVIVRDLTGEEVVTLEVARAGPEGSPFHVDAWREAGAKGRSISLMVALTAVSGEVAPVFYPGSHRLSVREGEASGARLPMEMERLSVRLLEDGVRPVNLMCAAGDVWIRHPGLLHGSTLATSPDCKWAGLVIRYWAAAALPRSPVAPAS